MDIDDLIPVSADHFFRDHNQKSRQNDQIRFQFVYFFKKDFIKGIKGMRLYFSVQNALTITGYKGLDPEVGGSLLTPGTDDRNKYPTTRSYTFGVNLNF